MQNMQMPIETDTNTISEATWVWSRSNSGTMNTPKKKFSLQVYHYGLLVKHRIHDNSEALLLHYYKV